MQEYHKRVLFVINRMDIGGAETMVLNLAQELRRRGYFVGIASAAGQLCPSVHDSGIPHYHMIFNSRSPLVLFRTTLQLRRAVQSGRFQVLNPQSVMTTLLSWWAISPLFPFWWPRPRDTRLVTTINNINLPSYLPFAAKALQKLPFAVIFESEHERQRLRSAGMSLSRTSVVHCGVYDSPGGSRAYLESQGVHVASSEFLIGTAARLCKEKGLDFLLRSVAMAISKNQRIRLLVVGDGEERSYLESLAHSLGIHSSAHFLGARSDVMQLLSGIDAYAVTSTYDTLPRAVREAMMCGKPVVTVDVGGLSEAVTDGVTGLVVQERSEEAFAQAMLRLSQDQDLARRMGEQGRRIARERFGVDRWVDETLKVFGLASAEPDTSCH